MLDFVPCNSLCCVSTLPPPSLALPHIVKLSFSIVSLMTDSTLSYVCLTLTNQPCQLTSCFIGLAGKREGASMLGRPAGQTSIEPEPLITGRKGRAGYSQFTCFSYFSDFSVCWVRATRLVSWPTKSYRRALRQLTPRGFAYYVAHCVACCVALVHAKCLLTF